MVRAFGYRCSRAWLDPATWFDAAEKALPADEEAVTGKSEAAREPLNGERTDERTSERAGHLKVVDFFLRCIARAVCVSGGCINLFV